MITITIDAGIYARKALAVLNEGGMGFQSNLNPGAGCRYLYRDGSRCAIGAGLPIEALAGLDDTLIASPIGTLLRRGVFQISSAVLPEDELGARLAAIQACHDSLMLSGLTARQIALRTSRLIEMLLDLVALHPEGPS